MPRIGYARSLSDGFIHHVRKLREQAKAYAKEMAYRDWEGAAANVSKAAELLRLFIDDTIDEQQPFGEVKRQAQQLLKSRDIESLCLYLNQQKRAMDDYMWEFYDQHREFVQQILRPIFLCLSFEGSNKTQALAAQLLTMRAELSDNSNIITSDRRLIRSKYQTYLINDDNQVQLERYECLMYLMIQTNLDGRLYIPTSIKYRALHDDLTSCLA